MSVTPDPTSLGDMFVGLEARLAATVADRAPLDPSRIGIPRQPLPQHVRKAVLLRDEYTCQWCRATPRRNGQVLEVDHIVPWSAGGADHPVNLRVLCQPCNQERSNRVTELDWRAPPITLCCRRCAPASATGLPTVSGFCLACQAVCAVPYVADLLIGGAVPSVGIPPLSVGDVDYASLDGRRPSIAWAMEVLNDRARAQAVDCPWCSAPAGEPCVRGSGAPLVRSAAHPARLAAAGVAGDHAG